MSQPTVFSTVQLALKGRDCAPWERHLAFALARSMDDHPSASTAKELRALLMSVLGERQSVVEVKDPVDDIAARRAARRAAAGS